MVETFWTGVETICAEVMLIVLVVSSPASWTTNVWVSLSPGNRPLLRVSTLPPVYQIFAVDLQDHSTT